MSVNFISEYNYTAKTMHFGNIFDAQSENEAEVLSNIEIVFVRESAQTKFWKMHGLFNFLN
jgi:hypothetical protein